MPTLPEGVGLDVSLEYVDQPTNTFLIDWTSKQIAGMDAGLAAMRQAVEIILQNERFCCRFITAILARAGKSTRGRICLYRQ